MSQVSARTEKSGHPRKTISSHLQLDIRQLARDGLLTPGEKREIRWSRCGAELASVALRSVHNRIQISSWRSGTGGETENRQTVRIAWTKCNLGGQRAWFICPGSACNRRVAILYGGRTFACRHCHKLAYPSTRESRDARARRRVDQLRRRLRWPRGFANGIGTRPKGMRWSTYLRLLKRHEIAFADLIEQMRSMSRVRKRDLRAVPIWK